MELNGFFETENKSECPSLAVYVRKLLNCPSWPKHTGPSELDENLRAIIAACIMLRSRPFSPIHHLQLPLLFSSAAYLFPPSVFTPERKQGGLARKCDQYQQLSSRTDRASKPSWGQAAKLWACKIWLQAWLHITSGNDNVQSLFLPRLEFSLNGFEWNDVSGDTGSSKSPVPIQDIREGQSQMSLPVDSDVVKVDKTVNALCWSFSCKGKPHPWWPREDLFFALVWHSYQNTKQKNTTSKAQWLPVE